MSKQNRTNRLALRYYQQDAVDAIHKSLDDKRALTRHSPCVVIPTGGGKTLIIAQLCSDYIKQGKKVLVATLRQELIQQSYKTYCGFGHENDIGMFSAEMGHQEMDKPIIFASINSIYWTPEKFGNADLIIVDECHRILPKGTGIYRTLFEVAMRVNPDVRAVGLTASPYRLRSSSDGAYKLYGTNEIWTHCCYSISVDELVEKGYLCHHSYKQSDKTIDYSGISIYKDEFNIGEAEAVATRSVHNYIKDIVERTSDRKKVLIFCVTIGHAMVVVEQINLILKGQAGCAHSTMPGHERDIIIESFLNGEFKYFCDVNVLGTDSNVKDIDCVVMLRPTISPGLYHQAVAKGFHVHPDKSECLILDYAGNTMRHGFVSDITDDGLRSLTVWACPECGTYMKSTESKCSACSTT